MKRKCKGILFSKNNTYYSGLYEEVVTVGNNNPKKINYIMEIDGLNAVYIEEGQTNNMYYVAKDHLGSITSLINPNGTVAAEYSYDPWGRRRNPADWEDYNVAPFSIINRGYTGHEHLEFFKFINMNGRIYDPISARFTTPDPFVQNPGFSQEFNRYSYVNNNPMRYTDPSGYMSIGCGHNPYWVTVAQQVAQGHETWNDILDYGSWRGLYSHSGFGGAQANYYSGKSLLASGTVADGLMGSDMFTDAGIAFIEENFGVTPVNQGGVWGYFKNVSWSEGEQINYQNEQGYTVSVTLQTFAFKNVFVPIGDGGNGRNGNNGDRKGVYLSNLLPVAKAYSLTGDFFFGAGASYTPIMAICMLQGQNAGEVLYTTDAGGGAGMDISGSLNETNYFYRGDLHNVSSKTFSGPRLSVGASVTYILGLGATVSISSDNFGGILFGVSANVGYGTPGISVNANWGVTKIY